MKRRLLNYQHWLVDWDYPSVDHQYYSSLTAGKVERSLPSTPNTDSSNQLSPSYMIAVLVAFSTLLVQGSYYSDHLHHQQRLDWHYHYWVYRESTLPNHSFRFSCQERISHFKYCLYWQFAEVIRNQLRRSYECWVVYLPGILLMIVTVLCLINFTELSIWLWPTSQPTVNDS